MIGVLARDEHTPVVTAALELLLERNEDSLSEEGLDAPPTTLGVRTLRLVVLRLPLGADHEFSEVFPRLLDTDGVRILVQHPQQREDGPSALVELAPLRRRSTRYRHRRPCPSLRSFVPGEQSSQPSDHLVFDPSSL